MKTRVSTVSEATLRFPDWAGRLGDDPTLVAGLRESYRQTVARFLAFCAQRQGEASVQRAREFVELARLEQAPSPARLQEWKDALNWYFRRARATLRLISDDRSKIPDRWVPPLARTDQGQTAWEAALIGGLRERHCAWRTEQAYRGWLWRFVRWLESRGVKASNLDQGSQSRLTSAATVQGNSALADVGAADVKAFLSKLAVEDRASGTTQKQALNALVFYFREVEGRDLGDFSDFVRARKRTRVPVVLNRAECERLFGAMEGTPRLMAELMFGSGIRLMELLRLRVKDVDLERGVLIVRAGKGNEDRVTVLPVSLQEKLRAHRERLRRLHGEDRAKGLPGVWLPEGLERKWPHAGEQWEWQWFWLSLCLGAAHGA